MKVKKEVKEVLNDLKVKLKNEFPLIRNLCRRENTIHFFGGTHLIEGDMTGCVLDRVTGVEQNLDPYTDFIENLNIPNLSWERKEHYPGVPYILVTLNE
tara:strand:+ start:465 stop:761 length:297 start_codon:yes stop_codon:yes gene_type:complete